MNLMTSEYNVERAKLEASKAEIVSEIEGAKNRIQVGVSEGELKQVKTVDQARARFRNEADLDRLEQKKDKTVRDVERAKSYLEQDGDARRRIDGIVNILPNFRSRRLVRPVPPPLQGRRQRLDRRGDRRDSRSVPDAHRAEAGRSRPRQAARWARRSRSAWMRFRKGVRSPSSTGSARSPR